MNSLPKVVYGFSGFLPQGNWLTLCKFRQGYSYSAYVAKIKLVLFKITVKIMKKNNSQLFHISLSCQLR